MTKRKSSSKSSAQSNKPKTSAPPGGGTRSRTKERRLERQRQKRQQQRLLIGGGIIFVTLFVAVLLIVATQPASAPIPDGTEERYAGIPQTVTEDGWYRLGRTDAPVRIEEFSSFACPACADFNDTVMDGIIDIVVSGQASFVFVPQTNAGATAANAARGAICAGQQGMFFEYHDALFDWLNRFGNQAFSQNRLISGAENLGLNVGVFEDCLSGSEAEEIVNDGVSEGQARSIPGTPSTFVQGVEVSSTLDAITAQVEVALQGIDPSLIVPIDRDGDGDEAGAEATEEPAADTEAEATEEPAETEATEEAAGSDANAEATEEPAVDAEPEATEEADE